MSLSVIAPMPMVGPAGERHCRRVLEQLRGVVDELVVLAQPDAQQINEQSRLCRGRWLWIHHPQLLLPFPEIAAQVASSPELSIKPYRFFWQLSQQESENPRPPEDGRKKLGGRFGKASYLLDRELFLALGGLHPELGVDGEEGFELGQRLRHFFARHHTLEHQGLWLFRAQSPEEKQKRTHHREVRRAVQEGFEAAPDAGFGCLPGFDPEAVQQLVRNQALKITRPTHPTVKPARLEGEMWALTTFFNPERYRSKKENYSRFRHGLPLPLCTVELAFDEQPFELSPQDADLLIQIRGGDVLWQKERLLNLGLERLPDDCDKVAWLDADVLFDRPDWAQRTAELLERHVIVQPFSLSVRLRPGESRCDTERLPLGSAEHQVLHSIAYGVAAKGHKCLGRYLEHGHSGYAWAGRRQTLQRHGLYEANILGNADLNIAQAMFGGSRYLKTDRLSPAARAHLCRWADAFYGEVDGSVGYLEGTLFHLWHGNKSDRLYHGRLQVLVEHEFDPERDLRIGANGTFRWASQKAALHDWCRHYFAQRQEDPV